MRHVILILALCVFVGACRTAACNGADASPPNSHADAMGSDVSRRGESIGEAESVDVPIGEPSWRCARSTDTTLRRLLVGRWAVWSLGVDYTERGDDWVITGNTITVSDTVESYSELYELCDSVFTISRTGVLDTIAATQSRAVCIVATPLSLQYVEYASEDKVILVAMPSFDVTHLIRMAR